MKNKFVKLLAISAVIFGSVSCKDEVAAIGQKAPDIAAYDLQETLPKMTALIASSFTNLFFINVLFYKFSVMEINNTIG